MVEHDVTGLLYKPGDSKDLASSVSILMASSERLNLMRAQARAKYLAVYTEDQNYRQLMDIFHQCITNNSAQPIRMESRLQQ